MDWISRVWFLPLLYLTEEARYTDEEGYVVVTADSFRGGSIFKDKYLHFKFFFIHRQNFKKIDCLMACTAFLVCLVRTLSGCPKNAL